MIQRFAWLIMRGLYKSVIKPLVFLSSPDLAHARTVGIFAFLGQQAWLRWLTRTVFKTKLNKRLMQNLHGIYFENPVGLSAGFDKNGEVIPIISNLGFGFGEVGSVTAKVCAGNIAPWFYRLPKTKSLVVNAGLPNDGSNKIINRLKRSNKQVYRDFSIILSVAKTNSPNCVGIEEGIEDYVTTIKKAKNSREIGAIELNISCPNTFGGEPFTNPASLDRLLKAVKKVNITKPIFVKMPSHLSWTKNNELLKVIVKYKLAGVTISNLMKSRDKLLLKDSLPDDIEGNLSGAPTKNKSNELIKNTYREYGGKLTIIGVGGIFSVDDAYQKIRLGSSLVEFISGMIFEGPQLASEINYGLDHRLKRDGFSHISDAIGVDAG